MAQTNDPYLKKRALLLQRTARIFSLSIPEAEALLSVPILQSFRINTLKPKPQLLDELRTLGWKGEQYPWYTDGYSIMGDKRLLSDSIASSEGAIYVQNASSWLPVLALDPKPGQRILDACAAPGGKASHIAALTNNQAELWVNDNSKPRLHKLTANFNRLGAQSAHTSLSLVQRLASYPDISNFDGILLDAPCSGEGLLDINKSKDFAYWSIAQIKRLQQLQKKTISHLWQLVRPGGVLIYATCTMAPEENEAVLDYFLRKNDDATLVPIAIPLTNRVSPLQEWQRTFTSDLSNCIRVKPTAQTEAFFVAKIRKSA
jgi:16S rRNA (cytosine1407-C5)-methyltransferase